MKEQKQRAFGIGCFHFGYRPQTPFEFKTASYIEAVGAALKSLPSLSKLTIDYDESFAYLYYVDSEPPSLIKGEDYFPSVQALRIHFSIYIPFRVQEEVLELTGGAGHIGTENFSVFMLEDYHGPATFIECLDAPTDCDPSDAVRLLREYLAREFIKIEGPISFEYLGPSPFHANFFLEGKKHADGELSALIIPRHGYDQVVFVCGPEGCPADEDMESLYYELAGEVSLFYTIQRRNLTFMRSWSRLVEEWESLNHLVETKIRALNISHRFEIHRASKRLISNAYTFGVEIDIARRVMDEELASTYDKGTPVYLEKFVRSNAERLPKYPVGSVLGWAKHVNEASFKQAEIAAVIFAGLIGGIVGSLITASMGG